MTLENRNIKSFEGLDERTLNDLYGSILDNVSSGVALIDENGRFILYNKEFLRLFGLSEDTTIINVNDQKWSDWEVYDENLELLHVDEHPVRKVAMTGKPVKNMLTAVRLPSGGDLIWMLISAEPIFNGPVIEKVICTYQDITRQMEVEQTLKENEARLRDLVETKNKFFNIIAHDLRNPFTSLIGTSELLLNNTEQLGMDRIKFMASIINEASKNGFGILQNLLEWTRSQTGMLKIDPEIVNIRDLIDKQIQEMSQSSFTKEIELTSLIKTDIQIKTDRNILNTIFRNLIDNAIKFTHRNGKVFISASQRNGKQVFSVKDTGIGISKEKIDKLFLHDNLHTMPGTEMEKGTGLGLKLCREFVEKLNGEIWVESIEYEGSTFSFSIPDFERV